MGSRQVIEDIFEKNSRGGDISVIEGVMGLFDGARDEQLKGSTAHIALILNAPVVLVVDVKGLGRSCLPLIQGFKEFEPALNLSGVILNKAGGDFYRKTIKNSIEEELGIRVFGCLPNNRDITIPERRLGLLPAEVNKKLKNALAAMADMIETRVDLDGMIEIAGVSGEGNLFTDSVRCNNDFTGATGKRKVTIGVAKDRAFGFYYQDNLDYLQELGATLKFFSPLNDSGIPGVDGLYIGGGFPDKYLAVLSDNTPMINSIKDAHFRGLPVFAEGEGFMYLARQITDSAGKGYKGVGLVPADVRISKNLNALGYVRASALNDSVLADKGDTLRGHEFHYTEVAGLNRENSAFSLLGGRGADNRPDGFVKDNLIATSVHFHFRSNPRAAAGFVGACLDYKKRKGGFTRLRSGFTTGACAAAATKAALEMILNKRYCEEVRIDLPRGGTINIPIKGIVSNEGVVTAEVVKDAGDDLDVTNGMSVFARVETVEDGSVVIRGGRGVGKVTKPGLAVPVGEPAINPVPMEMIKSVIKGLLPSGMGVLVTISAPEGEKLASRTFNPRLGIVGGISILGTTGIVRPMSEEAYIDSLIPQINQALALNHKTLVLTPGGMGANMAAKMGIPRDAIVQTSNFIGAMLKECAQRGVKSILLFGHIGKLIKVSAGIFHTHSKVADARREILVCHAAMLGASGDVLAKIMELNTMDASVELIKKNNLNPVYTSIAESASKRSKEMLGENIKIGSIMYALSGEILGYDNKALELGRENNWHIRLK